MDSKIWLNRTQPQTLQIATLVMYFNGVLGLLAGGLAGLSAIGALLGLGSVAAGLGLANERKLGYWFAVAIAILPLALVVEAGLTSVNVVSLMFEVALVVLLLHPMTRDYRRSWFR